MLCDVREDAEKEFAGIYTILSDWRLKVVGRY